jgi:exodeoxyribonuclease VII small subunit
MAKKQTPPKSFEDALSELEQILAEIESGNVSLEQSIAKYERGNFLITHCRGVLKTAETQIELLNRAEAPGVSAALDDDSTDAIEEDATPGDDEE